MEKINTHRINDELETFGLNFSRCANRGLALAFNPLNLADCYMTWQSYGISTLCLAASNAGVKLPNSLIPPPPSTPSPHLNCTSHNSANWPGISSRTITVITGLCQARKPKVVSLGGVGEFLLFQRLG